MVRQDLTMALQKKRPSVKLEDCFLHYDNAAPHVSEYTQRELTIFGVECLKHPPYSPELAPVDFAIFPEFKSQLRGQRFCSVEDLKQSTAEIIAQYDSNWNSGIFDQWETRHERCVFYKEDCFKKK